MEKMDELALLWDIAKDKEDAAKEERISIENQMLALHPAKEEGSTTVTTERGVKVTMTGKLSYKTDLAKLQEITAKWPDELKPIKVKVEADEAKLKAIRAELPKTWAEIAPAITTTPAKTGVTVKFNKE